MPDASTQTTQDLPATRKPVTATTQKKYDQAIKRLEDAKLDLTKPIEVLAWIKEKGGESAQKVYLSAIKQELAKRPAPFFFPKEYQEEIDRLYARQNEKDKTQELSEKQQSNFVSYEKLLEAQKRLAEKEDKSDKEWLQYVVASLYTLQPPVRLDYNDILVARRRLNDRDGNELIWGQKKGAYFVFRKYKTSGTYGTVEVRVSPALHSVLESYFAHLGKIPKRLLGNNVSQYDLAELIKSAFKSTKKEIGVNLLRHAYITHYLREPRTIKEKETLAMMMLHSKDRQEAYAFAKELKDSGASADKKQD